VSRNIRVAAPLVYAAAVVVGFLINSRVGVIVTVGGAILLVAAFMLARGGGPAGGRDRNRG
jgi:hypothetical protein